MRKIAIAAAALLISAGTSVAFASASSASVCRPNGSGCTKAGTYPGPNAVINRDFLGVKVVWTKSVVKPYSSGVPLYWTAYVTYTNITSGTLTLGCPGPWANPAYVTENMSGGSGDDGTVPAESTSCSADPGMNKSLAPGASLVFSATFHNVPWPGSAVAIHWGGAGTSAPVHPFSTSSAAPVQYGTPWNGYVHTGRSYSVGAEFQVPHLKCSFATNPLNEPAANPWVGLGGAVAGSPLVQIGIISRCAAFGAQVNYLVWEQIPPDSGIQPVPTKLAFAGDTIFASVDYLGGTKFYMDATDTNRLTGWHWDKTIQEPTEKGAPVSAEWIVEAGGPALANFGTVNFEAASFAPNPSAGGQLVDNAHAKRYIAGDARRPQTRISDIGSGSTAGSFSISYIRS
jgi:hypothetical protein